MSLQLDDQSFVVHVEGSKTPFHLLIDKTWEVDIRDITRACSKIPRFNTHTCRPYSVAEHQMMVEQVLREEYLAPPDVCLQGLVHDATEAYIGDIPAPVKWAVPGIVTLEQRIWARVARYFSVDCRMDPRVKHVDKLVLFLEAKSLCTGVTLESWDAYDGLREEVENLWPKYQISRGFFWRVWSLPLLVRFRYSRRLLRAMRVSRIYNYRIDHV